MTEETTADENRNEAKPGEKSVWSRVSKPLLGVAILIVIILWSVGVFSTRIPGGTLEYEPGLPVPAKAELFTVKSELVAPRVDIVGTVASEMKVNLSARIPATVKEVFVAAGSVVKAGQVLVTLDDREIKEQVAAAEAQFKQGETELNRARQLYDNKATTEQALTSAQSMFASARAQWERSKVMLTYAQISSPMDGVVTDRRVEPGDLANPGQLLLTIYDPADMQLEVPVPVRLLGKLPIGQVVEVTLDRPATNFQGKVRQIVSEIDSRSRTQLVKVRIESAGSGIMPGTFGRLWVADDNRSTIVIPSSAVYAVGQIELVQVVKEQRAIRRTIRTGPKHGESVEILAGLDAGDVVLVNPVQEN